jgi:hypothetical protein
MDDIMYDSFALVVYKLRSELCTSLCQRGLKEKNSHIRV